MSGYNLDREKQHVTTIDEGLTFFREVQHSFTGLEQVAHDTSAAVH